jgi:hypothetical protein
VIRFKSPKNHRHCIYVLGGCGYEWLVAISTLGAGSYSRK